MLTGLIPAGHGAAQTANHLRDTATVLTVLFAATLYLAMHFTPRLSKRMLLAPTLWTFWNALGAFPASLYLEEKTALVIGIAQTLLALAFLFHFNDRSSWQWTSREDARQRPFFTWRNFLLSTGLSACAAVIFSALLLHAGAFMIAKKTNGYVRIRPSGAFMEERRFQRTDKEVRLVAMVHIAQRDFYEEIANTLPENKSAAVLLEGVSDEGNLLKKKFGYSNIAGALGLTSQSDSTFQKNARNGVAQPESAPLPEKETIRNPAISQEIAYVAADVDVAVFSPVTLHFLEALGNLLGSKTLSEALVVIQTPDSPLTNDAEAELVFADILDKRNEHLITEIEKALPAYDTLVIPWGAMHLPVIQAKLEKWGFKETQRFQRKAFSFQKRSAAGSSPDKKP
ncbi:MAG: hypothetical protein JWL59_122 [Chthoniobacteraceae bacterium]|nr:hypothetical protein [Chthoniobacteraceae bacterium]